MADLDGDGDLDVVISNDDPDPRLVYLNDGKGHFHVGSTFGRARSDATNVVHFAGPRVPKEEREQSVTNDDLRILLRTDELLKDESVWNRKDDRNE